MKMQITFKSGTQIEVDVEEFTVGRGRFEGDLRELKWTTPASPTAKLKYVNLDEVAAIVALRGPADFADEAAEVSEIADRGTDQQ